MFIKIQAVLSNNKCRLSNLLSKFLVITLAFAEIASANGEPLSGKNIRNSEQVEQKDFCLLWNSIYKEAHRDFRPFIGIHETADNLISADSLVNFPHTQCEIFVDLKKENSNFICEWKYTLQDKIPAIKETLQFSKSIRGCINAKYPAKNEEPLYAHKTPLTSSKTIWSDLIIDSNDGLLQTYISLREYPDKVNRKGNFEEGYMQLEVEISYNEDE